MLSIAKIYEACLASWKLSDEIHTKLLEQYALRDENGEIKRAEGGERVHLKPETLDEYNEKHKEFQALEVEFNRPKISLEYLSTLDLSPVDVQALLPFLEYDDEVTPAAEPVASEA